MFKLLFISLFALTVSSEYACDGHYLSRSTREVCDCLQYVANKNRTCDDIQKFATCVNDYETKYVNPINIVVNMAINRNCDLSKIFEFSKETSNSDSLIPLQIFLFILMILTIYLPLTH